MIVATSPVSLSVSVVAVVASSVFVATIRRHRSDPAARPMLGIAVTLFVGAALHLAVVELEPVRHALGLQRGPAESAGGFWTLIAFDVPAIVGAFWFLFALQYTGRDRKTTPIAFLAVAALLVLLVGLNVAFAVLGIVVGIPASTLNTVLGITVIFAESFASIGVFLVLATTLRHKAFPGSQTAMLTVAVGSVLMLPFLSTTFQSPITTPVAVAASALLFTVAVRRYRIFETLPVASVLGRDRVIDEMSEGVVIIEDTGRIRDLNPEAASLLGVDRSDVVGTPLDTTAANFPDPGVAAESGPRDVHTDSGRTLAVTADTVTDSRGRQLGHLFICRDVTDKRRREHRLAVLTQLVAGATTDQMRDVVAVTDEIVAGDCDPEEGGDRVLQTATDTATLVARVRRVEQALADRNSDRSPSTDVREIVDGLQLSVDADVTGPASETPVLVVAESKLLTATLETLATGAGTASASIELRVNRRDELVTVEVAPRGEGSIPDLALDIARLAADHAEWDVGTTRKSKSPTAVVHLPTVRDSRRRSATGSESV